MLENIMIQYIVKVDVLSCKSIVISKLIISYKIKMLAKHICVWYYMKNYPSKTFETNVKLHNRKCNMKGMQKPIFSRIKSINAFQQTLRTAVTFTIKTSVTVFFTQTKYHHQKYFLCFKNNLIKFFYCYAFLNSNMHEVLI